MAILGAVSYQGYTSAPLFSNLTAQGWFPEGLFPIFATMLIVNFAFKKLDGWFDDEMQKRKKERDAKNS